MRSCLNFNIYFYPIILRVSRVGFDKKYNKNELNIPVESKSPSSGLRGLEILFLFDGECFRAVT